LFLVNEGNFYIFLIGFQYTWSMEDDLDICDRNGDKQADQLKALPEYYESNKYINLLYKKIRALNKKLDKAKKVEQLAKKKNAQLHEEQKILLNAKYDMEITLRDYKVLLEQFESIAKEEYEQSLLLTTSKCNQENQTEEMESQELQCFSEQSQQTELEEVDDASTQVIVETLEAFTSTIEQELVDAMTGPDDEIPKVEEESSAEKMSFEKLHFLEKGVFRILRLLHVSTWCLVQPSAAGGLVPWEVDFYSKLVLGKAPSAEEFDRYLQRSVEAALAYIKANGVDEYAGNDDPHDVMFAGVSITALDNILNSIEADLKNTSQAPLQFSTIPPAAMKSRTSTPLPNSIPLQSMPQFNFMAQPSPALEASQTQQQQHEGFQLGPGAQLPVSLPLHGSAMVLPSHTHQHQHQHIHAQSQQLVQEAVAVGGWHRPGATLHTLGGPGPGLRGTPRAHSPQPHPADVMGALVPPFHHHTGLGFLQSAPAQPLNHGVQNPHNVNINQLHLQINHPPGHLQYPGRLDTNL